MKTVGRILWYFAFLWVVMLCGGTFLQYYGFKNHSHFLEIKAAAVKTGWYLPAFYFHIIGSSIILFLGFFQFLKAVYNHRKLHKLLGKVYIFGVLFFAAPGAYVMTLFINRGPWVFTSFLAQNTLWVAFTLSGWVLVVSRKIEPHIKMMRRSYALAFGAVTLRFYTLVCHVWGISLDFSNNYIVIAFLSWVPNILIAEAINYYNRDNTFELSKASV
jgi:hypothetical protein